MVFDPTFQAISEEADQLPDLAGDLPDVPAPEGGTEQLDEGGILAATDDENAAEEEQDATVEGAAAESIVAGEVVADDLPAYGAE